jgi:hypothetical protein
MSGVNIKDRFVEAIRRRAVDDRYIDRNEEREILQIALQLGMPRDAARADLTRVCGESGYVLESDVVRRVRDRFPDAAGRDGRIDRTGFERLVAEAREFAQGRQPDREVRRLVITAIEDTPTARVRTGWLRNWYKSIKKELGMA